MARRSRSKTLAWSDADPPTPSPPQRWRRYRRPSKPRTEDGGGPSAATPSDDDRPAAKPARRPTRTPAGRPTRTRTRKPAAAESGARGTTGRRRRRGLGAVGAIGVVGLAVVLGIAVGGGEDDADPVDTSTLDTAFLTGALTAAERETGGRALEVSISDYSLVVRSAPLPVGSVGSIGSVGSVGAAPSAEPPAQPSAEPSEAAPDAPRVVREFSVGPGDPGYRVYVSPVGDYVPPALELDDLDLDRIVREVRAGLRAVDGVEYFTARVALEFDSADASVRQLELTTIVRGSDERLERTLVLTGPNAGERSQERSEVD